MRHRKKSERFSRSRAQKKALVKSLLKAVIANERIVTTTSRAKYLKAEVDRLVTLAKKATLSDRRIAFRYLGDHKLVKRLFDDIAPRFKGINGGYTRSLRLANRKGDGASTSLIELTRIVKIDKPRKNKAKETKVSQAVQEEGTKEAASGKEVKAKKGFVSGVRKIFKKDKDAL